jgi:hypothetical protein
VPLPFDLGSMGMPGCNIAVSPDATLIHGWDNVSQGLLIPNVPSFYGLEFYVQGVVAEPGANTMGLIWSRALRCVIGR